MADRSGAALPQGLAGASERDRRAWVRQMGVWLPAGLWAALALAAVATVRALAVRHRGVGTADALEAELLAWQVQSRLPLLTWTAVLAGPAAAWIAFRMGGDARGRRTAVALGAALTAAALGQEALWRGWSAPRELAWDDPLAACAFGLLAALAVGRAVARAAAVRGPYEDAPLSLRPLLGAGPAVLALFALAAGLLVPRLLARPPVRLALLPIQDLAPRLASDAALVPASYRIDAASGIPPTELRFPAPSEDVRAIVDLAVRDEQNGGARVAVDLSVDGRSQVEERALPGTVHRVGGPAGCAVPAGAEGVLHVWLEHAPAEDVGLRPRRAPLVELRQALFARAVDVPHRESSRARPGLVVVRWPAGRALPEDAGRLDVVGDQGGALADLAIDLLGAGIATAALSARDRGRLDGVETSLRDVRALRRWLAARDGLRIGLLVDAQDLAVDLDAVLGAVAEARDDLVWLFLPAEGAGGEVALKDTRAVALPRDPLPGVALRDALLARCTGLADSVTVALEGRAR